MRQRVVITGIGGICGLGTDAAAIWEAMRAGRSAIGPIENVELHELKVRVGSQVKALPEHGIDRKQLVSMDRFSLLAVIAAREAMAQAACAGPDQRMAHGRHRRRRRVRLEAIEENYRRCCWKAGTAPASSPCRR